MAGLLLGTYNILVLDEPGNHLDVETVEALANALEEYKGTVIFTSHDRHFMSRVATNVIEVKDGCAKNYLGGYEAYLYAINKELEVDKPAGKASKAKKKDKEGKPKSEHTPRAQQKLNRKKQKEIKNLEKKIAQLEDDKKSLNQQLLESTDAAEALKLHSSFEDVCEQLEKAEGKWLDLTESD